MYGYRPRKVSAPLPATKCRKGDLAVVVSAIHQVNVGRIVRVIELHCGKGPLAMKNEGPVWLVSCSHQMKWTSRTKVYRRKLGPVPDYRLQPIRGNGVGRTNTKGLPRKIKQAIEQN
jgi:hypothetical protein